MATKSPDAPKEAVTVKDAIARKAEEIKTSKAKKVGLPADAPKPPPSDPVGDREAQDAEAHFRAQGR